MQIDNVFSIDLIILFSLYFVIIQVYGQSIYDQDDDDSEIEEELPTDNYLFVTLIDIVFTDGSKRTCTGTIIHDNVVITAAHCFSIEDKQPELTASFVVIGTKKMFDTGYEQYLPIERIIIHPNHRSWTADLALVYTFAGMMSDKPGRIVRLASEKTSTDSDVTVFSWGRCQDEEPAKSVTFTTFRPKVETCSDEEKSELNKEQTIRKRKSKLTSMINIESDIEFHIHKSTIGEELSDDEKRFMQRQRSRKRKRRLKLRTRRKNSVQITVPRVLRTTQSYENILSYEDNIKNTDEVIEQSSVPDKRKRRKANKMTYYRNNWRRKMGDQKNKLTIEVFGFVNTQTCKKLVEKAMSSLYSLKNLNEIICYSSENHYITEEDVGAPAMRLGRLVAVTVGGVELDGERVAIGMKIICFCSWIADNLPKSGAKIQCCKKCCEIKEDKKDKKDLVKHSHKKRKNRKI